MGSSPAVRPLSPLLPQPGLGLGSGFLGTAFLLEAAQRWGKMQHQKAGAAPSSCVGIHSLAFLKGGADEAAGACPGSPL